MSTDTETINFDTSLSPALFTNSDDRRDTPRVPFDQAVRVGPAYGAPYASLKAENLSSGGIFIKTDKKAEPGAKFSVELSLPNYGRLYIPEVEVLYNRFDDSASCFGFGASFTGLTDEVEDVLKSIACFPSEILAPNGGDVSASMICDSQSLMPSCSPQPVRHSRIVRDETITRDREMAVKADEFPALRISDLTLSLPPEPGMENGSKSKRSRGDENTDIVRVRSKNRNSRRRTERISPWEQIQNFGDSIGFEIPSIRIEQSDAKRAMVGGLMVGGVFAFLLGVGIKLGSSNPEPAPSPTELVKASAVSADTHDSLLGKQASIIGLQNPAPTAPIIKKEAPAKPLVRASIPLPPVSTTKVLKKAQATKKAALAATTQTVPTKVEPKAVKKISGTQEISNLVAGEQELSIAISRDAIVLRSYVLKSPARLVIDVAGQDGAMQLPSPAGAVTNIRTGEHTGYTRIVIDSNLPIKDSKVEKEGHGLKVSLNS